MLFDYFGFIEQPFGVTPDPRFLHFGSKHREALASLVYGTEMNRGFLALIAPPGMGKTSLLFHFLEGLRNRARTAFLFHHANDPRDLMRYLIADIELDGAGKSLPEMHEMLNRVLTAELQAGRRFVLVIDEAHNMSEAVLESVRLLSNFETPWMKLMQIVLSGQPQLGRSLARPSMWQLRQRISSFIRLQPLTAAEISAYIDHRLWVAGYKGAPLFAPSAKALIGEHSDGIPRNINNLCFQSLSIACAMGKKHVDSEMVREVIGDLSIENFHSVAEDRPPTASHEGSPARSTPSATLPAKPARQTTNAGRRSGRKVAIASFAVLFLGFVSGAFWKSAAPPSLVGATPSVEAAAFPSVDALSGAPETTPSTSESLGLAEGYNARRSPMQSDLGATQRDQSLTVVVKPGVTLKHLGLLYLDRYDSVTLAQIRALNPTLTDPNHIEAGQLLRLPPPRGTYVRPTPATTKLESREGLP